MFDRDREELNHEVALDALKEQAGHKKMLLEQFIYEFGRINKAKDKPERQTSQIVKLSRKVIEEGERILIVVEEYLQQLGMAFLHQLITQIYKAFVLCFHSLSDNFSVLLADRKLISLNDSYDDAQIGKKNWKNSQKKLQYLDSAIKDLEEQQQKIEQKKKLVESQMLLQNKAYMKITPSDAANQLESINNHLLKIIINSDKISGENVLYRYQDLSRKILTLKKPDQIQDEFCTSFSNDIRSKFVRSMQKVAKQTSIMARNKERKALLDEMIKSKVAKVSSSTQTQQQSKGKTKQMDILNKQKKSLLTQNDNLNKIILQMKLEIENNQSKLKIQQSINQSLNKKIDSFQDQLVQKMNQIDQVKKLNQNFKMQIKQSQNVLSSGRPTPRRKSEEIALPKCKTLLRTSSIMNAFENQLKIKTQEAQILKQNFQIFIQKIGQLQFLGKLRLENLFQNLNSDLFNQKISQIIVQLQQNVLQLKTESNQKTVCKTSLPTVITSETQTTYVILKSSCIQTDNEPLQQKNSNKLDSLKKNFLEKISQSKKIAGKKHTLNSGRNLNYSQFDNMSDLMSQQEYASTTRAKIRNSKLATSFEEFNFSSNNGQSSQKKNNNKMSKKLNTQESQVFQNSIIDKHALKRQSMRPKYSRDSGNQNLSHFAKVIR